MDFSREKSLVFLRAAAQALFDENQRLKEELEHLRARLGEREQTAVDNTILRELLEKREHALFGRSSERRPAPALTEKPPRSPQRGHGHREQPELEVVPVEHDVPIDERVCRECGQEMEPMGTVVEETELVTVTERSFVLEQHRCRKYRCRCNGRVVTAQGPLRLVKGGRYSPAFATEVAVGKYADHLPLERQATIMKREGLRIDSQTLWDQLDAQAALLKPTYELILQTILTAPVLGADETWWLLMDNGKTRENKTYQTWALVSPDLVAYRILDSRSMMAASTLLGDYRGVVMADGYTVYRSLADEKGFVVANCWAHVRRKFVEAQKNFPEECGVALDLIAKLYEVERDAREGKGKLAELRTTVSRPIVEELFTWARDLGPKVLPRCGLAEALRYMLNLEAGLRKYLDNPRIPIDNNASERTLRSVVVGRKNHYGSRSRRGTEVAAIFYTLMECAKLAGVSPKAYLLAATELALRKPGSTLLPANFKKQLQETP